MNIFEKASRKKLLFETQKGNLSVEDLWDLPLKSSTGKTNLDDIAIGLAKKLRETNGDFSFVDEREAKDEDLELSFEIVKHVIQTLRSERDHHAQRVLQAAQRQNILQLIAQKQNAELANKSIDELKAMASGLA